MTKDNSIFGGLLAQPMREPPRHTSIKIDFSRPDGAGVFSAVYDLRAAVDIGTINRNLADGYRIVKIAQEARVPRRSNVEGEQRDF